jgi:hypothetical protein
MAHCIERNFSGYMSQHCVICVISGTSGWIPDIVLGNSRGSVVGLLCHSKVTVWIFSQDDMSLKVR